MLSRLHGSSQRSLPGVGHRTSSRYRGSLPLTHIQRQPTLELYVHNARERMHPAMVVEIHVIIGVDPFPFYELKFMLDGKFHSPIFEIRLSRL